MRETEVSPEPNSKNMNIKLTTILLDTENPIRWNVRNYLESIPVNMLGRLSDQLTEKLYEPEFQFENIMIYVALSYEYFVENKIDEALKSIETGEAKLKETGPDSCMTKLREALQHILLSTKTHLLKLKNEYQAAVDASSEIPKLSELNDTNRAALQGLKAVIYSEYGINGSKKALELADKAIAIDNKESLWHFLKGKYLGRIRRVEKPYDPPTTEEISSLETSIKLELNSSYTVLTAQMYREAANRVYRNYCMNHVAYPQVKHGIDKLNEESAKLYKKSLELKEHCPHMAFRCAKGFIMLPEPHRDVELAKQLLKRGLLTAPQSGYGNHVMAQYYERVKKDVRSAMKHLEICKTKKIFGAVMDLIRLEYRLDQNANKAVATLEEIYDDYTETARKTQLLSQLASFHLFVLSDLVKACEFVGKIIRLNTKCDDMVQHRPICVFTVNPINLYDVVIDEIKIKLQKDCSPADRETFMKFLTDLNMSEAVSVRSNQPQYLKSEILMAGNNFKPKMFHTERGAPMRGRPGRGGPGRGGPCRGESWRRGSGYQVSRPVSSQFNRGKMNVPTYMKREEAKPSENEVDQKMKAFGEACKKTVIAAQEKVDQKFYSVSQNKKDDKDDESSDDDFNKLALTAFQQAKEACNSLKTDDGKQNSKKPDNKGDNDVTKELEKLSLIDKGKPQKKDTEVDNVKGRGHKNRAERDSSVCSKKRYQNREDGKDRASSNCSDSDRRRRESEGSLDESSTEERKYSRSVNRKVSDREYYESRNRGYSKNYKNKYHDDGYEGSGSKSYDSEGVSRKYSKSKHDESDFVKSKNNPENLEERAYSKTGRKYEKLSRDMSSGSDSGEHKRRSSRSRSEKKHQRRDYSDRRHDSRSKCSDSEAEYSRSRRKHEKFSRDKSSGSDSRSRSEKKHRNDYSDRRHHSKDRRGDSKAEYSKSRKSYDKYSRDKSSGSDSRSRSERKYRDDYSDRRHHSRSRRHSKSRTKHRVSEIDNVKSRRSKRYDHEERSDDTGNESGRETVCSHKSSRSMKTPSERSDYSRSRRKYHDVESSHKHHSGTKTRDSKYDSSDQEASPK